MSFKKRKVTSIVLLLLSVLCVIFGLILRLKNAQSPHADFRLLDEEEQVVATPVEVDESLPDSAMHGGTVTHGGEATYDVSSRKLSFIFKNSSPEQNDIVISLLYEDATIWQSGLICSGKELASEVDADINLEEGVYDCILNITNYDHETGEKALFSLTADVKLVVIDSSQSNDSTVFYQ